MTQTSTTATEMDIKDRVVRVLQEFTKASPMGSITTGMLTLLIKPNCTNHEFESLLDSMEEEGMASQCMDVATGWQTLFWSWFAQCFDQ